MALWHLKLSTLKRSLLPLIFTFAVGLATFFSPWLCAHASYLFVLQCAATNLAVVVATKQLPDNF